MCFTQAQSECQVLDAGFRGTGEVLAAELAARAGLAPSDLLVCVVDIGEPHPLTSSVSSTSVSLAL